MGVKMDDTLRGLLDSAEQRIPLFIDEARAQLESGRGGHARQHAHMEIREWVQDLALYFHDQGEPERAEALREMTALPAGAAEEGVQAADELQAMYADIVSRVMQ